MADLLLPNVTLTAEQFYERYAGKNDRVELVDGRVVQMAPVNVDHGDTSLGFGGEIRRFARAHRLGRTMTETGFILRENPDLVLAPDVAFVSNERIATHPAPRTGYWPVAPNLVVEVMSPDDTRREVEEKLETYFGAGCEEAWVVDPVQRTVTVCRVPKLDAGDVRTDFVEGGILLPGFRLDLSEIWD